MVLKRGEQEKPWTMHSRIEDSIIKEVNSSEISHIGKEIR